MARTNFCEYKRRFQTHGLVGLKGLPPIHKSDWQTTLEEHQRQISDYRLHVVVDRVVALSSIHTATNVLRILEIREHETD